MSFKNQNHFLNVDYSSKSKCTIRTLGTNFTARTVRAKLIFEIWSFTKIQGSKYVQVCEVVLCVEVQSNASSGSDFWHWSNRGYVQIRPVSWWSWIRTSSMVMVLSEARERHWHQQMSLLGSSIYVIFWSLFRILQFFQLAASGFLEFPMVIEVRFTFITFS